MGDPERMVEIVAVDKAFGDRALFRGLALRVERGELVAVVGPSGSGKTTLLRLIAGLELPDAGRIERGELVLDPRDGREGSVALVSPADPRDDAEVAERVGPLLSRFGLDPDLAGRPLGGLSAGERQGVALARALAGRPALLLLDEPTGGMDPELRRRVGTEVARLHRELGTTLVLATQDPDLAAALSTRVVVLPAPSPVDEAADPRAVAERVTRLLGGWSRTESELREAWVERGRRALERPELEPDLRIRLALQLAYELGRLGRWEESRVCAAPVEGAAPPLAAELWRARIMALGTLGRLAEAREQAAELFAWAEASGDPGARAHAHHALATARLSRGEPADAIVEAGIALAREARDVHTHLALLTVRAHQSEDSVEAAETWREVLALARAAGHRPKELTARFRIASIGRRTDPAAALAELAAIGAEADQLSLAKLRVMVRGTSAMIRFELGHPEAEGLLREVLAAAEVQGFREAMNNARLNLADLLDRAGRRDEARFQVEAVRRGPASDRHRQEAARRHAALTGEPTPTLELATDGAWFRWRGERVELPVRSPLRRLLVALAAGGPKSVDELRAAGWPGERMHPESARNRVHVALSTLRRKGLGEALRLGESGWQLDPDLLVRWVSRDAP